MSENKGPASAILHLMYISLPSSTWQRLELTKFEMCRGREDLTKHFKIFFPNSHTIHANFIYNCDVGTHFLFRTTWGCNETVSITGNNNFGRRSR